MSASTDLTKSTEVRNALTPTLQSVWKTGRPCLIQVDGKAVAQLQKEPPTSGTPPKLLRAEEARRNWADLLNYIAVSGARYFFRNKKLDEEGLEGRVYLVRASDYRNPFDQEWKEHRARHMMAGGVIPTEKLSELIEDCVDSGLKRAMANATAVLEELFSAEVEKLRHTIGVAFASATRPNGDLLATPELGVVPLKTEKNLGNFDAE